MMNEIRLIDANALKEELRQYFTNGAALYQILTIIDNAPTVNTEECEGCPYCPNSNSGIPIGVE